MSSCEEQITEVNNWFRSPRFQGEAGLIIVAEVSGARTNELLNPDRVALRQLINKEPGLSLHRGSNTTKTMARLRRSSERAPHGGKDK